MDKLIQRHTLEWQNRKGKILIYFKTYKLVEFCVIQNLRSILFHGIPLTVSIFAIYASHVSQLREEYIVILFHLKKAIFFLSDCRLCGSKICALCSQFLSFESAGEFLIMFLNDGIFKQQFIFLERLTGIKSSVVSSSLLALINGDDHFRGGLSLSVDKVVNYIILCDAHADLSNFQTTDPNTSNNFALSTLGSSLYAMKESVKKLGAIRSIVNKTAENNERSLRICGNCKNLLGCNL